MMTMRKTRGWWLLGGLLLLALALPAMFIAALPGLFPPAAIGGSSGLPAPVITVSFIGYTNGTDGSVQAQFAVSNITSWRVLFQMPRPMVLTNGQWSDPLIFGQPKVLAPREQVIIQCAKPVGVKAWRLPISHGPLPSRFNHFLAGLLDHLPWHWARLDTFIQYNTSVNMTLAQSAIRTD